MADSPFSDSEINRQIQTKILRLQAASLEWDDNPNGVSFDDHIVETAVASLNAHAEPYLRKVDSEDRKNQYVRHIRRVGSAQIRNLEERGMLSDPHSEERLRKMAENSGSFMSRIRSLTPAQQETEILNEIERLRGELRPTAKHYHEWLIQIRSRIETRFDACYQRWEAEAIERLSRIEPARRGYRSEVRQWMKLNGLKTIPDAAERLFVSQDILKSIMSGKGEKRYGDDTLKLVLEKIKKKSAR